MTPGSVRSWEPMWFPSWKKAVTFFLKMANGFVWWSQSCWRPSPPEIECTAEPGKPCPGARGCGEGLLILGTWAFDPALPPAASSKVTDPQENAFLCCSHY